MPPYPPYISSCTVKKKLTKKDEKISKERPMLLNFRVQDGQKKIFFYRGE